MSESDSPYLETLKGLLESGIAFVLVGVGAINFYAKDAGSMVATQDLDLLGPPDARALRVALVTRRARCVVDVEKRRVTMASEIR